MSGVESRLEHRWRRKTSAESIFFKKIYALHAVLLLRRNASPRPRLFASVDAMPMPTPTSHIPRPCPHSMPTPHAHAHAHAHAMWAAHVGLMAKWITDSESDGRDHHAVVPCQRLSSCHRCSSNTHSIGQTHQDQRFACRLDRHGGDRAVARPL